MAQLATAAVATRIPAGTWKVDPAHSSIEFGIKHLLITTVKGYFGDFDGTIEVDEDGTAKAVGTIKAESVSTNQGQRDQHLQSPDFFDVARFPELRFESTSIEHVDGNRFRVTGDLSIKETTREIELEAEFTGANRDPYGQERIGLTLRGSVNPTDFGVDWNQELETGGKLVGDRAEFTVAVSAIKQD